MRCEDPAGDMLPVSCNGKRTLPATRWTQHGAEDCGGNRANSAGRYEAWPILEAGKSGTGVIP
jgi:hypothetical protein